MKIPIKAAKELAKKYGLSHVIIYAHQREPSLDHIVTFGQSLYECDQAAQFGNQLKDVLGWPESLKSQPSRVRKLQKRIKELEDQLRAAEQCVHLPIGGEQVDGQENDENDRPKANWKCPKCYLINAWDWPKCERCGHAFSETSKQDETDTAPQSDGR